MKTLRSHRPLFSSADNSVNLTAPKSWRELTQEQLRYVFFLLSTFGSFVEVKTYMLMRFTGIKVERKTAVGWVCSVREAWWKRKRYFLLHTWQVEDMIRKFDYVESYEDMGCRLEALHGLHAVDVDLHGVTFEDYLSAEKYYQLYTLHKKPRFLDELARRLYRKKDGSMAAKMKLSTVEQFAVFCWYSSVKSRLGREFPHFFHRADGDAMEGYDIIKGMNVQIRALTEGDVTKEKTVYAIDCWRALTELNEKARESEEFRKKYK